MCKLQSSSPRIFCKPAPEYIIHELMSKLVKIQNITIIFNAKLHLYSPRLIITVLCENIYINIYCKSSYWTCPMAKSKVQPET